MFSINLSLIVLAIIYSFLNLQWQTDVKQQPIKGTNVFLDFFDKKHVVETMKTLVKRRDSSGRLGLWLLFLSMSLYAFQRDEKPMSFLYTQLMFKWNVADFSHFRMFQSILFVLGMKFESSRFLVSNYIIIDIKILLYDNISAMLFGVPIMSKALKMKDTWIVVIGTLSHSLARVIFSFAKKPVSFYVGE